MKTLTISWDSTLAGERLSAVAPCGCRLGFPAWLTEQKVCRIEACGMHTAAGSIDVAPVADAFKELRWLLNPVDHPGVTKD